ncbi:polyphosphate kinase 2 family protein [Flavihumibacter sp. UBA7668]|uniref:polyphosphate kinase 2 family protein n=1 Tax=Flavihumibacter sp. UBA7668 TaxID=1946542 RepID=UPI0025C40314|nr:polyphosphate kinase 2 family protein [Flavihumibacter sp. UBA7668]
MNNPEFQAYLDTLKVQPQQKLSLKKDFLTDYDHKSMTKEEGESLLQEGIQNLSIMQDKLYAHNRHSILIVLQAMDAAGKDGAIKHVMSGLNPQGVKVHSFKTPSRDELDHDYIWRHYKALPGRGEIGIFNRSHYENVLVTRVHPEFILGENIPGIERVEDITPAFWEKRFKQINRFEKNIAQNGTLVLKFFLHVSKKEQKKRFLERIDNPTKNWKFSSADVNERGYWSKYMEAYEEMLSATSKDHAPWFVLPADDKWFTRLCMAAIIAKEFNTLDPTYPELDEKQRADLQEMREKLMKEENGE